MGARPTYTWAVEDVGLGRRFEGAPDTYDVRPRSIRVAVVNRGRWVVDVVNVSMTGLDDRPAIVWMIPTSIARATVEIGPQSDTVYPIAHDTTAALTSVVAVRRPRLSAITEIRNAYRMIPRAQALTTTSTAGFTTMRTSTSLIGGDLGIVGGANRPAGGPRTRGIILRAGQGLAVCPMTAGATVAVSSEVTVEFVVRDVATGKIFSFVVDRCASAWTRHSAVGYAALWNPGGSSEVVEVLACNVECEHDESNGITAAGAIAYGVAPWTTIEEAHPTTVDRTASVVAHDPGVVSLTDAGVRCLTGDWPMRVAGNDTLRVAGGTGGFASYGGLPEQAAAAFNYQTFPLPGAIGRFCPAMVVNSYRINDFGLPPQSRLVEGHRTPIAVPPGSAFYVGVAPQQGGSLLGAAHAVVDVDITFQVRRPLGPPFGRAA